MGLTDEEFRIIQEKREAAIASAVVTETPEVVETTEETVTE